MVSLISRLRDVVRSHPRFAHGLLACGVVGPAWWVAADIVGSMRFSGYSYIDQTISELSAQGAPTRSVMLLSSVPYALLMLAFGAGVWMTSGERRAQRITAALIMGEATWGVIGGFAFPMAQRGVETTLRNEMHAWYGIGMPILFISAIGFGSTLLGKRFRYFSYGTIAVLLLCGMLVAMQSSRIPANEPTPWIGVEERINAYASMLWLTVLAVGLLRANRAVAADHRASFRDDSRKKSLAQVGRL